METKVALMRSGYHSARKIALTLKVRRQSVDHILRRPHVAAMVGEFRKGLRAHGLLGNGALKWWLGES